MADSDRGHCYHVYRGGIEGDRATPHLFTMGCIQKRFKPRMCSVYFHPFVFLTVWFSVCNVPNDLDNSMIVTINFELTDGNMCKRLLGYCNIEYSVKYNRCALQFALF